MNKPQIAYLTETTFRHPALEALDRVSREMLGIGLTVVFPQTDGWGQCCLGRDEGRTDFCRLVHSVPDGLKHCRMCHVLMSVASCSQQAPLEQTCHAGLSALVSPATAERGECFAILSSCTFLHREGSEPPLDDVKRRLAKLHLAAPAVRKALSKLPRLTDAQVRLAQNIMDAAAHVVRLIRDRAEADARCDGLRRHEPQKESVRSLVESRLQQPLSGHGTSPRGGPGPAADGPRPLLLQVVTDLIARRPDVAYSVAEIAAAARLSPNHFSTFFHKHMKQSFSEYLLERRIELAKEVLRDLTLNITEVAMKVGYDDPGYFARRFRAATGMSPREWRQRLAPL